MKRVICLFVLIFTLLPLCFVNVSAKKYAGRALNDEWILEDYRKEDMSTDELEAISLAGHYRVQYTLDTDTGEMHIFCDTDENGQKIEQTMLPYADYRWIPWQDKEMLDSIKTVYIEEGILSIGRYSFYHCESLEEVYIPHSVQKIDRTTFYQCQNLEVVHYAGSEEDFLKRVNYDEVRNWYAIDENGDGIENADEIQEYFKDKIVFGESVSVVCKNEEGDEISSFTVGGYNRGDAYSVTAPEFEGLSFVGKKAKIEGTFKKNDKTVYEFIYHCDHEYEIQNPSILCSSVCKHCGRLDPEPAVAHQWGEVEVHSERGLLTPLEQSVKCTVCGMKVREYKSPLAPIICIAVAAPILLVGIVFAIVYPIRQKRKMKDLTW